MNIKEYLKSRKIDYERYRCWINEEEGCITFPLYDFGGRMVGKQSHRPFLDKKFRYDTHTKGHAMWGLDTVPEGYVGNIYLTESITRSIYLHRMGLQSTSILGSTLNKEFLKMILNHPHYNFVWVGDPDQGGKKLVNKFGDYGLTSPVDVDNMTDMELIDFTNYLKERYETKP